MWLSIHHSSVYFACCWWADPGNLLLWMSKGWAWVSKAFYSLLPVSVGASMASSSGKNAALSRVLDRDEQDGGAQPAIEAGDTPIDATDSPALYGAQFGCNGGGVVDRA